MNSQRRVWAVRLTAAAQADFGHIVRWTANRFGVRQSRIYAKTMSAAIEALTRGPEIVGVRRRDEIGEGLMSLHVARGRRKGRHFVMFRTGVDDAGVPVIDVLRLLHDTMDLQAHLP